MKFKEVVKMIEDNGYILVNSVGSHFKFKKEGYVPITIVQQNREIGKAIIAKIKKSFNKKL